MTPTKILIGQAAVTVSTITSTLWASTQWVAYRLGYQSGLGEAWFEIAGWPIFYPWRLFNWRYAYEVYAPQIFHQASMLAAGGGVLGTMTAIAGSLLRARHAKHVTTYGSAEWAGERDIRKSGLLRSCGVFLGRLGQNYLRHD